MFPRAAGDNAYDLANRYTLEHENKTIVLQPVNPAEKFPSKLVHCAAVASPELFPFSHSLMSKQ